MPNPNPGGRIQRPYSFKHLREVYAGSNPTYAALHWPNIPFDAFFYLDDFKGTLDAAMWATAAIGAGSAAPVFNAQAGGAVRCTTGGGNPGVSMFYGANTIFNSDDNPYMGVRFKAPAAVTNFAFEIGFVNVLTTKTTQGVSALTAAAVPTFANGVTDGVVLVMNTAYTLTTAALAGVGTSTAAAGVAMSPVYTPTAAKWIEVHIGVRVGVGYVSIFDDRAPIGNVIFSVASGPDTAILLFPYIFFKDNSVSKVVDVDLVVLGSERNTT